MELAVYQALQQNEQSILSVWQSAALSPAQQDLIIGQNDTGRFADPMSYVIEKSTAEILKWLIRPDDDIDLAEPLQAICRLKAVQDVGPSEALYFIFVLKKVIRESLSQNQIRQYEDELGHVDERIDEIALLAFDFYCACRSQIYELRVKEIKRMYGRDAG